MTDSFTEMMTSVLPVPENSRPAVKRHHLYSNLMKGTFSTLVMKMVDYGIKGVNTCDHQSCDVFILLHCL